MRASYPFSTRLGATRIMVRALLLFLAAATVPETGFAQSGTPQGDLVRLALISGDTVSGVVTYRDPGTIGLATETAPLLVPFEEVESLQVQTRVGSYALHGALLGAGTGLTIGLIAWAAQQGDSCETHVWEADPGLSAAYNPGWRPKEYESRRTCNSSSSSAVPAALGFAAGFGVIGLFIGQSRDRYEWGEAQPLDSDGRLSVAVTPQGGVNLSLKVGGRAPGQTR